MMMSGFVILGAQNAIAEGKLKFATKALNIDGCDYYFNATFDPPPTLSSVPNRY